MHSICKCLCVYVNLAWLTDSKLRSAGNTLLWKGIVLSMREDVICKWLLRQVIQSNNCADVDPWHFTISWHPQALPLLFSQSVSAVLLPARSLLHMRPAATLLWLFNTHGNGWGRCSQTNRDIWREAECAEDNGVKREKSWLPTMTQQPAVRLSVMDICSRDQSSVCSD